MTGLVYKSTGSWYTVKTELGETYECRIKGKFRIKGIKSTNPIAVGDYVDFDLETDEIDPKAQRRSVTANFIHGIDAAVVHRLAYDMKFDMGFVHDCFISHASNARKVHQDVRKTYKNIYAIDLLKEFRCELINNNPTAELPDLPELGTLDVSQIDRAMYLLS